ncbi:DUF4138 domain-containing protein [Chitinophagaceae bacterium 26-R-25]|nr:DUF4138 domain-containing protein [Chitinophagaceae bacterium 26-R-25]
MKKICSALFLMISFRVMAQQMPGERKWTVIEPYPIDITCNNTSNLIFPFKVISVDRGNSLVLVQKAKHVDNILQLKAAGKYLDTTNLSVVTADGKFYSFQIAYSDHPSSLNLVLGSDSLDAVGQFTRSANDAVICKGMELAENATSFMRAGVHEQGIGLQLRGIYLYEGLCYFKLAVRNDSAFPFDPEAVRLMVTDKHRVKRSGSQEKEMAVLSRKSLPAIDGNGHGDLIIPANVFTVAPKQRLVIRMVEKNNGRIVQLQISGKRLLRARAIK